MLVRYQDGHVELTVSDDGSGDGGGDSGGHGLVGMRERVSVYGGELEAGATSGGRLSAACETPGRMTGTYTFLLTDIEGSTSLVRQLREQYGDVLAEHHRVLRGIFEEAGGEGIGTQGDAFFVAFRRPKDAVAAALAGQRALVGHEWPHGVQPRVRMGIHTGEASISADEYHGLAVHRAARICAAGQGGQILVSQATHALLEDEELTFVDLGEQQLKDFERPVRVYELMSPDGADHGGKSTGCVRVLIVDDQALVRAGFRMILEAEADMEVAGEAADGRAAVDEARRLRPDVVLMDVRMPELDGIEATRMLLGTGRHEHAGRDADDVRHGRVRLRGPPRRRERLPAQGHSS